MLTKFGEIYKLFRESRKITLRDIEHRGISRSQLSRFEKGETDLTTTKFFLALEQINVPIEEFMYAVKDFKRDCFYQLIDEVKQCFLNRNVPKLHKMLIKRMENDDTSIFSTIEIIFLQIKRKLRKINQNLKAVSRLIKIQRFFTILAFSLIIWISISSVISMISQNPSKKKIYSYLQGENGIIKVVVYKISENYITQNAKIIENYNGKILILDTRSFYIINKEGIYNEEIKVENFNNIIRGAVINDDEAKIILEKLQDNNSLNELKKMLEVFIGKIYIKK